MDKKRMLWIVGALIAFGLLATWFDNPQTYEACMLEKMKGQGYYMGEVAKSACKHFPHQ